MKLRLLAHVEEVRALLLEDAVEEAIYTHTYIYICMQHIQTGKQIDRWIVHLVAHVEDVLHTYTHIQTYRQIARWIVYTYLHAYR